VSFSPKTLEGSVMVSYDFTPRPFFLSELFVKRAPTKCDLKLISVFSCKIYLYATINKGINLYREKCLIKSPPNHFENTVGPTNMEGQAFS